MEKAVGKQDGYPAGLNLEEVSFPCSIDSLSRVKSFVEGHIKDLDLPKNEQYKLVSAVDEAATNAVNHGSNENPTMDFMVGVARTKDSLVITVTDFGGKTFDPQYFEDICQSKSWGIVGGRGIYMMTNTMDEVMYLFNGGRSTTVCLIKYLNSSETG